MWWWLEHAHDINHVVPFSHQLTLKLFILYSVEFSNQIIELSFQLGNRLACDLHEGLESIFKSGLWYRLIVG
jgi:hypothetical protein